MKWQTLALQLETLAFESGKREWCHEFMEEASRRLESPLKLEALEKIDLVDQLQEWLEANGIESAWELAPAMVNFGWNSESLEKLKGTAFFSLSVQWLGTGCLMMGLVSEVQQTTERISQIVRAVKSYSYLDQAPLLEVDGHDGLENRLIILQPKLK